MAESRVVRVELYEDRATVTREVELPAEPGRHALALEGLSPLVRSDSLSQALAEGVILEEARSTWVKASRDEADPERAAALEEERAALSARVAELDREARREGAARDRLAATWAAALAWTPRVLAEGEDLAGWLEQLQALADRHRDQARVALDRHAEAEQLREALVDRVTRLSQARSGSTTHQTRLALDVLVQRAGARLRIRYTLPCALWRPAHRARLDEDSVHWEIGAVAWNATGEDWEGVELVCSTARPGERPSPPPLTDDVLRTRDRQKEIVVEARDETVQVAREGKRESTDEILGVDDGGEARSWTAPDPVNLPSNGRPLQLPLETWTAPTTRRWQAFPEKGGRVVLRSRQVNRSARPLLAGPVTLSRDNGQVGRGEVKLVPPGEPFELGWGNHDSLRVTRRLDREQKTSRLTSHQTLRFDLRIRVVNVGEEPVSVELRERMPVSELKEVKVSDPEPSPAPSEGPDADGFLTWRLEIPAEGRRDIRLRYTVDAPRKVTLPL